MNPESALATGVVRSVNVGAIREVMWHDEVVRTGIWKSPVEGPVAIRGVNLDGDAQADLTVHGGRDKAVYAYAVEDYAWFGEREAFPVHDGVFGENLTTRGLDLSGAVVGERWRVGTALLEVAQPRLPCFKLGIRVGDATFLKRFQAALRPGAYLRIVEEGGVQVGDSVTVLSRPDHGVTMAMMMEASTNRDMARAIQRAPWLPERWRG